MYIWLSIRDPSVSLDFFTLLRRLPERCDERPREQFSGVGACWWPAVGPGDRGSTGPRGSFLGRRLTAGACA
jgi:hypothetical protein